MSLGRPKFETIDDAIEIAKSLEKDLGLPDGFLQELRNSDDWSFIIKVHALMEASVSYLLVHHFGDDRLSQVFDFMELSDKRRGKIAIVKALDLMPDFARRFIATLSELRNSVVHNVNQVGFKLPDYVRSLNKDQFKNFLNAVESIDLEQVDFGDNNENRLEWVAEWAKELIYRMALITMAFIYQRKENAVLRRHLTDKAVATVSELAAAIRTSSVEDAT